MSKKKKNASHKTACARETTRKAAQTMINRCPNVVRTVDSICRWLECICISEQLVRLEATGARGFPVDFALFIFDETPDPYLANLKDSGMSGAVCIDSETLLRAMPDSAMMAPRVVRPTFIFCVNRLCFEQLYRSFVV